MWIGAILGVAIGVGAILLGLKGFSEKGIPVDQHNRITGDTAQKVGLVCFVIGVVLIAISLYGLISDTGSSDPRPDPRRIPVWPTR